MKKTILLLTLVSGLAFGAVNVPPVASTPGVLPADAETVLNLSATAGPSVQLGSLVTQKKVNVLKAVYDFSVLGGTSGSTVILKDAAGGPAVLPAAAVIKQVMIDEVTNVTGTGNAAIAFGVNTSSDLLASTAAASFSNRVAGIPVGTAATSVKTLGQYAVVASFSGSTGNITAGKLNLFIEYYLSD